MGDVTELVRRTERLQGQVDILRVELAQLRKDLESLQPHPEGNGTQPGVPERNCLAVALSLAEDLGPEFSAENPDQLAGRGDDWSIKP